jgi:hypothetical protein
MKVMDGIDGSTCLVFGSEEEADSYAEFLESEFGIVLPFTCYGMYMNALLLDEA